MNDTITFRDADRVESAAWTRLTMTPADFCRHLQDRSREIPYTLQEFTELPKDRQHELKDGPCFVLGDFEGTRRRRDAMTGRAALTLDLDSITPEQAAALPLQGRRYCLYSTAKHSPEHPRLRLILFTDRDMTAGEYSAVCSAAAAELGVLADPASYRSNQAMYYPTHCRDITPVFASELDAPPLQVDAVLGAMDAPPAAVTTLPDPRQKGGIIGAFCSVYDIAAVIDAYLADIYEPFGSDRYTYAGGETAGGAVVYDNGSYLYSHHQHDPANIGHCVNAYDLYRIHLFGGDDRAALTAALEIPAVRQAYDAEQSKGLRPRIYTDADGSECLPTAEGVTAAVEALDLRSAKGELGHRDDIAEAVLFTALFGRYERYNATAGRWYAYDGICWTEDPRSMQAEKYAQMMARAVLLYAVKSSADQAADGFLKWAVRLSENHNRKLLIDDARTHCFFTADELDAGRRTPARCRQRSTPK